jgi:hypothetical protein
MPGPPIGAGLWIRTDKEPSYASPDRSRVAVPRPPEGALIAALAANPVATAQLLAVAGITLPPSPPPDLIGGTVLRLLNYNILGTQDAQQQLVGQPYDNTDRIYPSPVDNETVPRFEAHMKAMFTTDGKLPQLASPFGHCTFTLAEVQGAFALLASQVTAQGLALR